MTTIRDFFIHIGETLTIPVQLLGTDGNPVNLANTTVEFATSLELDTTTIEILTSANTSQISVYDANAAIVNINVTPTANVGYKAATHVYQMRAVDASDKAIVYLEGRLFIENSLFD